MDRHRPDGAGNGTLGVGWSLSGLSAITRCHRTVAQDGAAGGVTLTTADRFCLDGRQLKLVSGNHGVAGSVYATEVEAFSRVVANGVSGAGPESFTVTVICPTSPGTRLPRDQKPLPIVAGGVADTNEVAPS